MRHTWAPPRVLGGAVAAYNGRQAVETAAAEHPDVVLLDLNMPVMDGFQAASAIRALYQIPLPMIVAVSALVGPAVEQKLRAHGFDH